MTKLLDHFKHLKSHSRDVHAALWINRFNIAPSRLLVKSIDSQMAEGRILR